jgi:NADPH:quinone reductase-like Zn-dependent oxidoreductase
MDNEALIQVSSSSVNPIDMDGVEPVCVGFGCSVGTIGQDVAGTVVVVGDFCPFFVGDQVWGVGKGAYAEYAVVSCNQMSLKPLSLSFMPSGAIPTIGLTALQMFQKIGTPLVSSSSVAIVSGQGGTGYVAVQLAKYFGAAQVITAATGPGINMVSSLGADVVTDYRVTDMFDTLADDSVDVVCDNLGYAGTADKAMRVIRPGGAYILLPTGHGGTLSNSTKDVTQINFGYMQPNSFDLSTLASLFDVGALQTKNMQSFNIADVPLGFTRKTSGNVLSKISVAVALEDSVEQTKSVRSSLARRRASEVV